MGFTGVLSKSFLSHNETIADAMMDRLIHTAHKIELKGPSMREILAKA